MRKKILVLVVAYNAEKTISHLLNRFSHEIWNRISETLVVDDCSQDKTHFIASEFKKRKKIKKLKIIKHEKNRGYGGNQKWGYKYAIKNNFDIVVMIHGDAQYPPEFILDLVKPIEEDKADFVFGSRMTGRPIKGGMPLYKFFGNIFLTSIENLILRTSLSEFHSGFRAYSVNALKDIPFDLNSDGFHFDSQIIFQLILAKKRIDEITIPTFYGNEKCNVKVVNYGLNILKELVKYILTKNNIKIYKLYTKVLLSKDK